ncbi:MAG: inositol monophosphatase family protein [Opitutales bacterium]
MPDADPSALDLNATLAYAEAVAREAGTLLAAPTQDLLQVNARDAHDVKMQADVASEELIRERLENGRDTVPGLPVIGEEQGGDPGLLQADTHYWVVDPLDGTFNYLRGQRLCCVSVGLMRGLRPILGVIHDFNNHETMTGLADTPGSLRLNGEPVTPQWADTLAQACLCTGFPAGLDLTNEVLTVFIQRIQTFKKIRMLGSAALAMAAVALGRADLYFEPSINLWDIAGGLALLGAGGGHFHLTPVSGHPLRFDCWALGREKWLASVVDTR